VSRQTVRNHLKRQDPSRLVRMSDDVAMKLRLAGALSKKCMLAIDTHDIMYYGDPDAEGIVGTKPRKGLVNYHSLKDSGFLLLRLLCSLHRRDFPALRR
jgi:hypothetical protein